VGAKLLVNFVNFLLESISDIVKWKSSLLTIGFLAIDVVSSVEDNGLCDELAAIVQTYSYYYEQICGEDLGTVVRNSSWEIME
jgi:hypothetical protein